MDPTLHVAIKTEKSDPPADDVAIPHASPGSGDENQLSAKVELVADLQPAEIVKRLDEYIIGQTSAKRAVAIALRNRIRRQRLSEEMRSEVLPKNILLIGPTGVGKTEIARRLAKLSNSPFIKVEATKFTEVGYVGRDVESIVRDLLEQTVNDVQNARIVESESQAKLLAETRLVQALSLEINNPISVSESELTAKLKANELEETMIELELDEVFTPMIESFGGSGMDDITSSLQDFFSQVAPPKKRARKLTVREARDALIQEETDKLVDLDKVYDEAIAAVEENGIVFIDEVDKICTPPQENQSDISGVGVQRDLLPILEGSHVNTRYGAVHTDYILFIGAGAFTGSRPSDLLPEFQGRFPIRVELKALSETDLKLVLTEPSNALTKQYAALLKTEGVTLEFSPEGILEIAHQAALVNEQDENIGARRLFTIMEKVLEDLSFRANECAGQVVVVDQAYVIERLGDLVRNDDLRRYVL